MNDNYEQTFIWMEPNQFCECCGLEIASIWSAINGKKFENGWRVWNQHKQREGDPYFLCIRLDMSYCGGCGSELDAEDLTYDRHYVDTGLGKEARSYVDGYKCSGCGHKS